MAENVTVQQIQIIELEKILENDIRQIKDFETVRDTILGSIITGETNKIKYVVKFGKTAKYLDIVTQSKYRSYLGGKKEQGFNIDYQDDILYFPSSITIEGETIRALKPGESRNERIYSNIGDLIVDYIKSEEYSSSLRSHDKKITIAPGNCIQRGMRTPLSLDNIGNATKKTKDKFKALGNPLESTGVPMSDSIANTSRIHSEAFVALARDIKYIWEEYSVIVDLNSDVLSKVVNYMIWELSYMRACETEKHIEATFNIKYKPNTLIGFSHGTAIDSVHTQSVTPNILNDRDTLSLIGEEFTKDEIALLSVNYMDQGSIVLGLIDEVDREKVKLTMLTYKVSSRVGVPLEYNKKDFYKVLDKETYLQEYSPTNRILIPYSTLSNTRILIPADDIWDLVHPTTGEYSIPQEIIDRLEPVDWKEI